MHSGVDEASAWYNHHQPPKKKFWKYLQAQGYAWRFAYQRSANYWPWWKSVLSESPSLFLLEDDNEAGVIEQKWLMNVLEESLSLTLMCCFNPVFCAEPMFTLFSRLLYEKRHWNISCTIHLTNWAVHFTIVKFEPFIYSEPVSQFVFGLMLHLSNETLTLLALPFVLSRLGRHNTVRNRTGTSHLFLNASFTKASPKTS